MKTLIILLALAPLFSGLLLGVLFLWGYKNKATLTRKQLLTLMKKWDKEMDR